MSLGVPAGCRARFFPGGTVSLSESPWDNSGTRLWKCKTGGGRPEKVLPFRAASTQGQITAWEGLEPLLSTRAEREQDHLSSCCPLSKTRPTGSLSLFSTCGSGDGRRHLMDEAQARLVTVQGHTTMARSSGTVSPALPAPEPLGLVLLPCCLTVVLPSRTYNLVLPCGPVQFSTQRSCSIPLCCISERIDERKGH